MGVLNTISGTADKAFSLSRYLLTAFEGSAVVRAREDNISTELDFKLNASNVLVSDDANEDTVATWLTNNSATNAYIVTLYDQSGNLRNYTNATAGTQPILGTSVINSLPAWQPRRARGDVLSSAASYEIIEADGVFISAVSQIEENRADECCIWSDPNASTFYVGAVASLGGWLYFADFGNTITAGTTALNTPNVVVWERPTGANPQTHTLRTDGTEVGSASLNTDSRAGTHTIGKTGADDTIDHATAELIISNSAFSSADRALIESDQGTQYNITIAGAGGNLLPMRMRY